MRYHLKRTRPGWLGAADGTEGAPQTRHTARGKTGLVAEQAGPLSSGPSAGGSGNRNAQRVVPGAGGPWALRTRRAGLLEEGGPEGTPAFQVSSSSPDLTPHPHGLGLNVGRSRGRPSTLRDGRTPATDTDICETACPHTSHCSCLS